MATITTLDKNVRTLVAAGTSNAAGAITRGSVDLRTAQGGLLTVKMTNGATGPTVAPTCNILIAHNEGATPALASAGADWKTLWSFTGDTTANSVTEQSISIDPAVMHLEVEFAGNTGQAVIVEAYLSEITSAVSV
jgi:Ca2+-binding RTX toxin-like protein